MPKQKTYPYLFDKIKQLSITDLKKLGYLHGLKQGTITWSSNGNKTASIGIRTNCVKGYVELNYNYKNKPVNYQILLDTVSSNIGNGTIYYFLCPVTGKRCRKLYLIGGKFVHRKATKYGMYECQTHTKKWRAMEKIYGCYFDIDKTYSELNKKHFKSFYNGKPTKRYLKLKKQCDKYEKIDYRDIERLMVFGY